MSKMVQIRNVPDALHRRLKARAALAGVPLSDFIRLELERVVEKPSRQELLERIARSGTVTLKTSAAALVRAERDRRCA